MGTERNFAERFKRSWTGFLIGTGFGVLAAGLLLCAFALILSLGGVPDGLMNVFVFFTAFGGAFACGFFTLAKLKHGGLWNGLIAGGIFFLLQLILGLLFGGGSVFSLSTPLFLALDLAAGGLGGIASVNLPGRR